MAADSEGSPAISSSIPRTNLAVRRTLVCALATAACFHIALLVPYAAYAILGFFIGLIQLARMNNARHAFSWGIALGWMIYVPHLAFFWKVFVLGGTTDTAKIIGAIVVFALWTVLPIWLGLFLGLAAWLRRWSPPILWIWLIPAVWTGIEYFRGELYPLKFSWLSAGYMFAQSPWMIPLGVLGMYGVGFALLLLATVTVWGWKRSRVGTGLLLVGALYALVFLGSVFAARADVPKPGLVRLPIGGVQLEGASNQEILKYLDRLISEYPETELCVLSEYTFQGPVPKPIRAWCREHKRYLVAGGKDLLDSTNFYNTVFVVGPDGQEVFKQAKSVPIQFFRDGLPASEQRVWHAPWGILGFCICYDLGYTRVTDELVKQGAQAIIAPTMDVADWGGYQHRLHARVAPIRAAEYGIPIFRLTSSGISQQVFASGKVQASRPFPGQGAILAATLDLNGNGSRPLDRWFAPACVWVTGITAFVAILASLGRERRSWRA